MGWKMVYNSLGTDEKTKRNQLTFDQNIRTVYSNIRAVNSNKNHVTTHPESDQSLLCAQWVTKETSIFHADSEVSYQR